MSAPLARRLLLLGAVAAFLAAPGAFEPLLRPLAPAGAPAVYVRSSLAELALIHVGLTALAVAGSTAIGLALAIYVTRPAGAEFLALSRALANAGQTFPPVAVLAIAVPAVGFGVAPILIALFLYGVLPVFENALAGLSRAPAATLEAALACGMTPGQRLREVELPLAMPSVIAGIRLTAVIGLATAAIGSTVAARTLGEVVLAGLAADNLAYVVQGAALIAAIAVLVSDALLALEAHATRRCGL